MKDPGLTGVEAVVYESTIEREMEVLRAMLGSGEDSGKPERAAFMQDFARLRARDEEARQTLLQDNARLKQVSRSFHLCFIYLSKAFFVFWGLGFGIT